MKKESVMIAVPSLDQQITPALATFCANLTPDDERDFETVYLCEAKPVDFARNLCVQRFLESKRDRLWFLDADGVPNDACKKMLEVDADIALGLVPVWIPKGYGGADVGHVVYNVYEWKDETDKYKHFPPLVDGTEEEVDAGGCAAMLIRRAVLEDPRMRFSPDYIDICGTERTMRSDAAPAVFRSLHKPNGEGLLGEDLYFCYRAKKCGYTVKYAPGVYFGHRKIIDYQHAMAFAQAMAEKAAEVVEKSVAA